MVLSYSFPNKTGVPARDGAFPALGEWTKGDMDRAGGTESSLCRAGARWGLLPRHVPLRSEAFPAALVSRCPGKEDWLHRAFIRPV